METWRRNLIALWIGVFLCSASYSMVVPFLPLFLLQIGLHHNVELWSGLLFSVAFLTGALFAPYWGALADRYGRRPMILRSGFALFASYILTAYVQDPTQLLILRAVQGVLAGYIPNSIALIGTSAPEKRVGWALSLLSTAGATGTVVGPVLGGAIARVVGNRVAFSSAGILMLIASLLVVFFVREDKFTPTRERTSVMRDLRIGVANRPLLWILVVSMLTNFSVMTIEPILPLYVVQLGGGSAQSASLTAGIVFSLLGVASILFAPRWGRAADQRGFAPILSLGLFGGAVGNFLQIPFHSILGYSAVRFVYGAFFCAVYPAINGLVVQATGPDFRGRAFGLNQSAGQLGTMLGPLVGGAVGAASGVHGVFWLTGALLLIAGITSRLNPGVVRKRRVASGTAD